MAGRTNEGIDELGELEYEITEAVHHGNELDELDHYANGLRCMVTY